MFSDCGIGHLDAGDPAHDRHAAKDRRRLLRVREHRQERGLVQDAEALGQHRVRGRARRRHAVDRRERAVDDAPVRAQELADRPGRVLDDLVDELLASRCPSTSARRREVACRSSCPWRSRRCGRRRATRARRAPCDRLPAVVAEQPAHLRLAPVGRRQGRRAVRRVEQRLDRAVRRATRYERLLASSSLRQRDRAAAGRRAERRDVEEPGRLQDAARDQVDAVVVGAAGCPRRRGRARPGPSPPSSSTARR